MEKFSLTHRWICVVDWCQPEMTHYCITVLYSKDNVKKSLLLGRCEQYTWLLNFVWRENWLEIWTYTAVLDRGKKFVQLVRILEKQHEDGLIGLVQSIWILEDALRDQVAGWLILWLQSSFCLQSLLYHNEHRDMMAKNEDYSCIQPKGLPLTQAGSYRYCWVRHWLTAEGDTESLIWSHSFCKWDATWSKRCSKYT